jgi:hypothetical protein
VPEYDREHLLTSLTTIQAQLNLTAGQPLPPRNPAEANAVSDPTGRIHIRPSTSENSAVSSHGLFGAVASDTLKPHGRPIPGTPGRYPGAGCRQRRATGVLFLLLSVRAFSGRG